MVINWLAIIIFFIVYIATYALVKGTIQNLLVPLLIAGGAAYYVYSLLVSMGL